MSATESAHETLIAELQNELDEVRRIRAELEQYRDRAIGAPIGGESHLAAPAEGPVSRRAALRTAGMIAAGALAGGAAVLTTASPAAATTGSYDSSSTEPALYLYANSGGQPVVVANSLSTTWPTMIVQAANTWAIDARTSASSGPAILASSTGSEGIGIQAAGRQYAGYFDGLGTNGIGVRAQGTAVALQLRSSQVAPTARFASAIAGYIDTDVDGNLWYCAADGNPGTWRKLAGPSTAGTFHPIAPARVYDSRAATPAQGVIVNRGTRTVSVADKRNADGSVNTANIIPAGATAIAANVAVTGTTDINNFCINPGGDTSHPASTINWFASGQTLANGVVLTLNANREVTIVAGAQGGSAHVFIDVTGYWM